jgi:hypothetical protein
MHRSDLAARPGRPERSHSHSFSHSYFLFHSHFHSGLSYSGLNHFPVLAVLGPLNPPHPPPYALHHSPSRARSFPPPLISFPFAPFAPLAPLAPLVPIILSLRSTRPRLRLRLLLLTILAVPSHRRIVLHACVSTPPTRNEHRHRPATLLKSSIHSFPLPGIGGRSESSCAPLRSTGIGLGSLVPHRTVRPHRHPAPPPCIRRSAVALPHSPSPLSPHFIAFRSFASSLHRHGSHLRHTSHLSPHPPCISRILSKHTLVVPRHRRTPLASIVDFVPYIHTNIPTLDFIKPPSQTLAHTPSGQHTSHTTSRRSSRANASTITTHSCLATDNSSTPRRLNNISST